jgi:hypothetical protein
MRIPRETGDWREDLSRDLDLLLADVCSKFGFCNRLTGEELLRTHPVLTGDIFAVAVLQAEKMVPEPEKHWRRRIARLFTDRLGDRVSRRPDETH